MRLERLSRMLAERLGSPLAVIGVVLLALAGSLVMAGNEISTAQTGPSMVVVPTATAGALVAQASAIAKPSPTVEPTAAPSPSAEPTATSAATAAPSPTDEAAVGDASANADAARALSSRGSDTAAPTRGNGQRIGLQVGHWLNQYAPAPFNTHTGASGGGKTEAEVNLAMAKATAAILEQQGYVVDVLPTWFTAGYHADTFVAIHCDGGVSSRRGFFAEAPASSSTKQKDLELVALLNDEHAKATGIPYVYRGTANSRYYYGFDRVDKTTPRALIETGFLSNATDRDILVNHTDQVAQGLAQAIMKFLDQQQ
ncbi:MAG: N-acetylmuramoyl-L-alanine amidase [Dehalococcoidales bacterium]|nr:N-acetylmuramoyl-L-alanine amidase [Dehalococcoidales bacterium]